MPSSPVGKETALSLIEGEGRVRSFHLPEVTAKTLKPILKAQIDERSYLTSDDGGEFRKLRLKDRAGGCGTVNHSAGEYVRTGNFQHTNTIEIFF
jgi:hypothetical protein